MQDLNLQVSQSLRYCPLLESGKEPDPKIALAEADGQAFPAAPSGSMAISSSKSNQVMHDDCKGSKVDFYWRLKLVKIKIANFNFNLFMPIKNNI